MKKPQNTQKMLRNLIYGLVSVLMLTFYACGGGGGGSSSATQIFVPKDAQFVLAVKFDRLNGKAKNWKDGFKKGAFKDAEKNLQGQGVILDILESESIDEAGAAYLFGQLEDKGGYAALVVLLKDEAKFEKAIKEGKEKLEVKSKEGWKYAYKKNSLVAWKGEYAIVLFSEMTEDELFKKAQTIQATKEAESLLGTESYKNLDKGDYDALLWLNQKAITQSPTYQSLSFLLPREVAPGLAVYGEVSDFSTMGLNFTNGQIIFDTKIFFNDKLDAKYSQVLKPEVNSKGLAKVGIDAPIMVGGLSMDMKVLYEILNAQGLLEDMPKELDGMTAQDIFQSLSGNVLAAAADFDEMQPEMVVAFELANQKNFEKFITAAAPMLGLTKEKDYYMMEKNFLIIKNNTAFLAFSPKAKDKVLAGKTQVPASFNDKLKGGSLAVFFDAQAVLEQNKNEVENAEALKKALSDYAATLTFKDRVLDFKAVVNMKDKSKNALEVLIEMSKELQPA